MKKFELLKRTYPISQFLRNCDGYNYILKNSSTEERNGWGINDSELQKIINEGEKYIYQVAKENGKFKIMTLCFNNYAIIKKHINMFDND